MKKYIFFSILGVVATVSAYGQNYIIFSNYYSSAPPYGAAFTYGNGPSAGLFVGPEISATLLYGPGTDTLISQLTPLVGSATPFGLGFATGPGSVETGAGLFFDGEVFIPGTPGSTYAFAIEATGIYEGQTYTGYSDIVYGSTQAASIYPVPEPFGQLGDRTFEVFVVPEPATLALASLGGMACLVALRRKQDRN
jgi:hypothetical protein